MRQWLAVQSAHRPRSEKYTDHILHHGTCHYATRVGHIDRRSKNSGSGALGASDGGFTRPGIETQFVASKTVRNYAQDRPPCPGATRFFNFISPRDGRSCMRYSVVPLASWTGHRSMSRRHRSHCNADEIWKLPYKDTCVLGNYLGEAENSTGRPSGNGSSGVLALTSRNWSGSTSASSWTGSMNAQYSTKELTLGEQQTSLGRICELSCPGHGLDLGRGSPHFYAV